MGCPRCQSDEWKAASLVYSEGLHSINTSTSAYGLGIGTSGIGAGIGQAHTNGHQQSALSSQAAPPARPSAAMSVNGFSFILVCALFGLGITFSGIQDLDWKTFFLGLALLSVPVIGILIFRKRLRAQKQYETKLSGWQKAKVCMRCGCQY